MASFPIFSSHFLSQDFQNFQEREKWSAYFLIYFFVKKKRKSICPLLLRNPQLLGCFKIFLQFLSNRIGPNKVFWFYLFYRFKLVMPVWIDSFFFCVVETLHLICLGGIRKKTNKTHWPERNSNRKNKYMYTHMYTFKR